MTERAYLDWNATAPLRPAAREAFAAALGLVGNPSSVHGEGRAARALIERARGEVAALVGADARNVVFTSGGTEANALALSPHLAERLFVSAIEHPSVLAGGRFADATRIPVDADGIVDLAALDAALANGPRALVSIMLANNESGVIQPVAAAAGIVHRHGGLLHVDAVQAAGRMLLDIAALGADMLTLSAHKLGGAKGIGALVTRSDIHLDPLIRGGGQERGNRAGTENVAAIAAFGAASEETRAKLAEEAADMAAKHAELEANIRTSLPSAVIFGSAVARLPNTTLVAIPGAKAETLVIAFDLDGVAVSSGAACSSGKVAPSHVLAAMGVEPALARGAIRVSLGPTTTDAEIERFLNVWKRLSQSLSKGEKRGLAASNGGIAAGSGGIAAGSGGIAA
jgi:cysteine desulfurase